MQIDALNADCYFSDLARDPDLADLVELFVVELADRLGETRAAALRCDWQTVGFLAHQLKGAAGSYGFEALAIAAKELEQAARSVTLQSTAPAALEALMAIASRVRAGVLSDSGSCHHRAEAPNIVAPSPNNRVMA